MSRIRFSAALGLENVDENRSSVVDLPLHQALAGLAFRALPAVAHTRAPKQIFANLDCRGADPGGLRAQGIRSPALRPAHDDVWTRR